MIKYLMANQKLSFRSFIIFLFGLTAHLNAMTSVLYFTKGTVVTKVDSIPTYRDEHLPTTFDIITVDSDFYLQFGIDLVGKGVWAALSLAYEDIYVDEEHYGKDESFLNFKLGKFVNPESKYSFGYGFEFDTRVNKYWESSGHATVEKVRIGIGPNLGYRFSFHEAFELFPNLSGYYYPWPNKDLEFIPKTFDSYGYRFEVPISMDVINFFSYSKNKYFVISAMPFYGSKSGFHSKNEQSNLIKNSSAKAWGIKYGVYWNLEIFTFMWK